MSQDDRTQQQHLTPDERRALLRAFADRMLLKVTAMDDPEDLPSVDKAVRTAAMIERIYSRCDRAERHAPDPRKLEAERAHNTGEAIRARVALAGTLEWGEQSRQRLGKWWDAAQNAAQQETPAAEMKSRPVAPAHVPPVHVPPAVALSKPAPRKTARTATPSPAPQATAPEAPAHTPQVTYVDYTDRIRQWRADLGLPPAPEEDASAAACIKDGRRPPPPA